MNTRLRLAIAIPLAVSGLAFLALFLLAAPPVDFSQVGNAAMLPVILSTPQLFSPALASVGLLTLAYAVAMPILPRPLG